MSTWTEREQAHLDGIRQRLGELREHVLTLDLSRQADPAEWFHQLALLKAIQGNAHTDLSFLACLLAKEYLQARFDLSDFDIGAKSQSAPGLDIDVTTRDGERIVGEVKTTVPYALARHDFGAQQRLAFQKDFDKLNAAVAHHRFLFVTDPHARDVLMARYRDRLPTVTIVWLFDTASV